MKRFITPDDVADAVRMMRTLHKGAILILEGDGDTRVYGNFIDAEKCKLVNAHNKKTAIAVLDALDREGFSGFLVIADKDFDGLEGKSYESKNLLLTDSHDLETMILKSPALEKVLVEFGSESKVRRFSKNGKKQIREILVENGCKIGYLRWVSLKDSLSLKFEGLSFNDFVEKESLTVDEDELIRSVKNHSQQASLDEKRIRSRMKEIRDLSHDPWHISCGHDLVCILSIGFQKILGSNNAGEVKPDIVQRSLRLAYEYSYFSMTRVYKGMANWEKRNSPLRILRSEIRHE